MDVPGVLLAELSLIGGGEATIGGNEGNEGVGSEEASTGSAFGGGMLCELEPHEGWLGRRGGGGAGAWTFARRLEERDLVESKEERRSDASVSSCWTIDAALE